MNQLMTMTQVATLTMSSREIAGLTGKEHSNVMRDVRVLVAELQASNLNPVCLSTTYEGTNGQSYPQYELDKDTCLTLLLGYDAVARMKVVKRWQELEAQQPQAFAIPKTLPEALRLAAEQAEALERQQAQLEAARPKVEFVERFVQSSSGSKGFREVCKLLNANEAEFRAFVMDRRIMYRLGGKLTAYQCHIDAGRFEVRAGVTESEHAYTTTKFTAKGVSWIAGEWAKYQVEQQVAA
ncbi:phage antirepressor KilAC domain-containing protein [Comamonas kerstersii]|nr:phage antirepressor KilAC domain-containing protein [Comamonas kerstersii]